MQVKNVRISRLRSLTRKTLKYGFYEPTAVKPPRPRFSLPLISPPGDIASPLHPHMADTQHLDHQADNRRRLTTVSGTLFSPFSLSHSKDVVGQRRAAFSTYLDRLPMAVNIQM